MRYKDDKLLKKINNFDRFSAISSELIYGTKSSTVDPFISIVIPTYRRIDLLKQSIMSAVNQSNIPCEYEIIIVDNDAEGDGKEIKTYLEDLNNTNIIYYKNNENIGMVGNWNRCAELAKGVWVSYLHDDDLLTPNYMSSIYKLLIKYQNCGAIISSFEVVDNNSKIRNKSLLSNLNLILRNKTLPIRFNESRFWNSNLYGAPTCGTVINKSIFINEGGFNPDFFPSSDWFFMYKLNYSYKICKTVEKLGLYRVDVNESLKPETMRKFIEDSKFFRENNRDSNIIGKISWILLNNILHQESVEWTRNMSKENKPDKDVFQNGKYFINNIKFSFYKKIRNIYFMIKKLIYGILM